MKNVFKRAIAVISATTLMATGTNCLPDVYNVLKPAITANAVEDISGDGWTFEAETGKMTVTTNDGTINWVRSISDKSTIKSVEIKDGVTRIENQAFQGLFWH